MSAASVQEHREGEDASPLPTAESETPPFSTLAGAVSEHTLKAIVGRPFNLTNMSPVQAAVLPLLPISALFAVNKPSGPTSMSVVNDIKTLACASRLFVDGKVAARNLASLKEGKKAGKKQRGKEAELKIGQGGTLDPLADGVLGVLMVVRR